MSRSQRLPWTEQHVEYLRNIVPGNTWSSVAKQFNSNFRTEFTIDQVKGLCKRLRILNGRSTKFGSGQTMFHPDKGKSFSEKTQFKNGHRPKSWLPVGSYRQCTPKPGSPPYWRIKVAENDWQFVHRLIWVDHNGPIPPHHAVLFVDGNIDNLSIDNLACVSRSALAILNRRYQFNSAPVALRRTLLAMSELRAKVGESKNKITTKNCA